MAYIIGVDIGTTGTKAVAFARSAEVLATSYESYPVISDEEGSHELDPAQLLDAVLNTLSSVIQATKNIPGLSGVSFSCAMHSLIVIDKDHTPLTRALTWADLRSHEQALRLRQSPEGQGVYEHCGTPIHAMAPLCKIIWLREKKPEIFKAAYKFISIKEYVWFHFFGKYQIDFSLASATALFDIRQLCWYAPALDLAGIDSSQLSDPVEPYHMENNLRPVLKARIQTDANIPFIIGASDGCLANLGTKAVRPGRLSLTIGTSGAIRLTSAQPRHDPKQRIFNYILTPSVYISGGPINNGGNAVKWFMDEFMKDEFPNGDISKAIAQIADISAGCNGLIFLPYLQGERAPIWDSGSRAVFFGIQSAHTRLHFMRSVLEGICYSLFQIGRVLQETVGPIDEIYASGGFVNSPIWIQMMADVFGKPVFVTNTADASAIGAAMLGLRACNLVPTLESTEQLIRVRESYLPDGRNYKIYQSYFKVFDGLYDKLKDDFSQLNSI